MKNDPLLIEDGSSTWAHVLLVNFLVCLPSARFLAAGTGATLLSEKDTGTSLSCRPFSCGRSMPQLHQQVKTVVQANEETREPYSAYCRPHRLATALVLPGALLAFSGFLEGNFYLFSFYICLSLCTKFCIYLQMCMFSVKFHSILPSYNTLEFFKYSPKK